MKKQARKFQYGQYQPGGSRSFVHDFGWAVRYRLVYTIIEANYNLPEFTIREVGPDNLQVCAFH